jgi:hypothetical protein
MRAVGSRWTRESDPAYQRYLERVIRLRGRIEREFKVGYCLAK